ncbi:MAG TPA: Si-specific NAD(P)(+) transhydrogenase [Abditibacteriaceae bacterium]|jgi:NAD(P) transhydrogenase
MKNYDLIVIGSGPAGEKGACQAALFGKSVALIEKEPAPGGAWVNTGTIPSKTLRESALQLSGLKQRGLYGVDVSLRRDISVSDFMYRERAVVEKGWELIDDNMTWHGIDVYRGCAHFSSPHEVTIDLGSSHITLHGEKILIATGSSPYRPEDVPFDDHFIYDSDSILTLDRIPKSMAVIGAGVIGCEYACMFSALGIDMSLIDGRTELLSNIDQETSDILLRQMRNRLKIHMCMGVEVESVQIEENGVALNFKNRRQLKVDKVLYAAGRQSNTTALGLDVAGVATGKRGIITVNENYQTCVPHIYAAGDVIGFPALASTSMEQGRVAAIHAFEMESRTNPASTLPYCIWTIPEVAMCGVTEEECLAKGIDYEVGRAYYRNNARGQIIGDTGGMLKLVFDPDTSEILGIHIVGESAAELVHVGLMVLQMAGTLDVFINTVFNVPTLSETYKYAAYDGLSRLERRQRGQHNGMGLRQMPSSTREAPHSAELPQVLEAPHALT